MSKAGSQTRDDALGCLEDGKDASEYWRAYMELANEFIHQFRELAKDFPRLEPFVQRIKVPVLVACDMDGRDGVPGSPTDAVFFLNFNFGGGPEMMDPLRECGFSTRPEDVNLGCDNPMGCADAG